VRVRAKLLGFYGNRRVKPGAVFECSEKEFSKIWMESLEGVKEDAPEQDAPAGGRPKGKGKDAKSSGDAEVI